MYISFIFIFFLTFIYSFKCRLGCSRGRVLSLLQNSLPVFHILVFGASRGLFVSTGSCYGKKKAIAYYKKIYGIAAGKPL